MQNFVKDRGPANTRRAAIGANAKIASNERPGAQQPQAQPGLPSRGIGHAQNSSAVMQQPPATRQQGQGHGPKRDPYDTDAESLDTTINQSVIQPENRQLSTDSHYQQHQVAPYGEASNSDEVEDEEETEEEEEEPVSNDGLSGFTPEDIQILERSGVLHLSREEKIRFLQRARPHDFGIVEGDSYPTTTNGDPTEWEERQESLVEDPIAHNLQPHLLQRLNNNEQHIRLTALQAFTQAPATSMAGTNRAQQRPNSLFQQSASIRGQQRSVMPTSQRGMQSIIDDVVAPHSSQPPNYSQASLTNKTSQLPRSGVCPNGNVQLTRSQPISQRQRSGPTRNQIVAAEAPETVVPHVRTTNARVGPGPHFSQLPVAQMPTVEAEEISHGDYADDVLKTMTYEQLKAEDFDVDPRAGPHVLADEVRQKPLTERLTFVQNNLEVEDQTKFFSSLPTTEWEDAGDWFLDQFQSIIKRTKEARQKKRKLAQEFEEEIEKRYKHVAKKQHEVENAMNKMKEQGEGLVPRSPRPSRSPKPKRY